VEANIIFSKDGESIGVTLSSEPGCDSDKEKEVIRILFNRLAAEPRLEARPISLNGGRGILSFMLSPANKE